jgi:pyrroline-5-carboxylate reductase
MSRKLGIVGGGAISEALINGLMAAGWGSDAIILTDACLARRRVFSDKFGIVGTASIADPESYPDTAILDVRAEDLGAILRQLVDVEFNLLITVSPEVPLVLVENFFGGTPVVRALCGSFVNIGAGFIAIAGGSAASEDNLKSAESILRCISQVVRVPESLCDTVDAFMATEPAHAFLMAESMIEAAVGLGVPRRTAAELTRQSLYAACKLMMEDARSPSMHRYALTVPAGANAAAMKVIEQGRLRWIVTEALEAAAQRAKQISQETMNVIARSTRYEDM